MSHESYAVRSCWACEGGVSYTTPADPASRPELITCGECGGSGEHRVFIYPKPKNWRGTWPPERGRNSCRTSESGQTSPLQTARPEPVLGFERGLHDQPNPTPFSKIDPLCSCSGRTRRETLNPSDTANAANRILSRASRVYTTNSMTP